MKANHNLPEFKKLIERYETITIEEIYELNMDYNKLTGFGKPVTCNLCKAVNKSGFSREDQCKYCVYYSVSKMEFSCCSRSNMKSYDAIKEAEDEIELFNAFRNRAIHMRSILKKLNLE